MSEFHVQVVRVGKIEKHPNADTLGLTRVYDYPVITRLGDFQEGDLAVYVPVDAIVPADDPRWIFLDGHWRVRAKKLRGIFSMGLLTKADPSWTEGQDVCELLRITKYVPPEPMTTGGENERDPGWMPVYTDIEGLRRWPDVLVPGEEVIVTEKRHGCVPHSTLISMGDGSRKSIGDVSEGDTVLGSQDGRIVSATVTRKWSNGRADRWLRIIGQRRHAGRGCHYFRVRCTPEHMFYDPSGGCYIRAADLHPGSAVLAVRSEMGMSPMQEQVLLGKMLGDGSLNDNGMTAHIVFKHAEKHREYVEWTCRAIGALDSGSREPLTSGYGSPMCRARTVNTVWIKDRFGSFFSGSNVKRVPDWVARSLTPLAVAFWYMDDGSLWHADDGSEDRAEFAACGFTKEDCRVLIDGLDRLGVSVVYYDTNGYSRLRVNTDDAERLFLLVAPYIPPCMQYKLPERYRGGSGWLPVPGSEYKPLLVPLRVDSVEDDPNVRSLRYDLETTTGNYFAHGILVHNSNARWTHQDGRLWCASHHNWKRSNDTVLWWKAARLYDLERKLQRRPDLGFYGEVFGQVQDLKYGASNKSPLFVELFDAMDIKTKRYLDFDDFAVAARDVDLPVVPVLFRGPWDPALRSHAEGKTTTAGADHVREGMVVRPVKERFDARIGRLVLKIHGEGYLTRKEK